MQEVNGNELGAYVQDRWRIGGRLTVEAGFRVDYDPIVEHDNYSPRAGMAWTILSDGRAILRGGYGKFVQRTPLNVEAFPTYEQRRVTRFAPNGTLLGPTTFTATSSASCTRPKRTWRTSSSISATAAGCC